MDAGKLNKRIQVLKPVDVSDGQGGRLREWAVAFVLWGSIKVPRNTAVEVQSALSSELKYEIVLRRNRSIRPGWHIECEGIKYEILHAYDGYDNATILQVRKIIKRS